MNSNNKIGVIFCAYNCEDYVEDSISPFLNDERFVVSAVSVPFLEYRDFNTSRDKTIDILKSKLAKGEIKYLIDSPNFIKEHEARNLALDKLKKDKCDFYYIADGDEFPKKDKLESIIEYISTDKESIWWRLCLKNFVFDEETYLEEPFCPPRIFKTKTEELSHPSFYYDNDISYLNKSGQRVSYQDLTCSTIPKEIAWIDHFTWPNDKRSRDKVNYQMSHFGLCSFSWDEKKGLTFNEEYYKLKGENLPKTKTL